MKTARSWMIVVVALLFATSVGTVGTAHAFEGGHFGGGQWPQAPAS